MKSYPSIPASTGTSFKELTDAWVFAKPDGSNLRFEWSKKRGWYKYGTRTRLFDASDPVFGKAIELWKEPGEVIVKVAKDERWESMVCFAEFHGPNSFVGVHDPADQHVLSLFDVAANKKGFLGPKDFVCLFGKVPGVVPLLGRWHWTRGFVERVRAGEFLELSFEGVVGKVGEGHNIRMAKAKSEAWIQKVKALYGDKAEAILNS